MSKSRWVSISIVIATVAVGAMLRAAPNETPANSNVDPSAGKTDKKAENDKTFHKALLKIASNYKTYGRVDDETRWAPWLCRMPMPARARFSESGDATTHGQKLYYLFAKDRAAYLRIGGKSTPKTGQVVVKESWHAKESSRKLSTAVWKDSVSEPIVRQGANDLASAGGLAARSGGSFYPYAKKGDKTYRAHQLAGLYIMFKTDAKTPGTDNGWVYGTVTADGKTVTASGRVASCMKCHADAPHDRLFGLARE